MDNIFALSFKKAQSGFISLHISFKRTTTKMFKYLFAKNVNFVKPMT